MGQIEIGGQKLMGIMEHKMVDRGVEIVKGIEDLKLILIVNGAKKKVPDLIQYSVMGLPICQYDQHSRARIGAKFLNYKVSEEPRYVFYSHVYDMLENDKDFRTRTFVNLEELEKRREEASNKATFNLMSRRCSYAVEQTWPSLFGQMMRRLKFCEEEFIVGLHWRLRDELVEGGVISAKELVPGCDKIKKCDYSSADYLSNMFGCLFASCGRWKSETDFATFNESCSTPEQISEQLGIIIPMSDYEHKMVIQEADV